MSIGGIGAGYFSAGYETKRAERNAAERNFADFTRAEQRAAEKEDAQASREAADVENRIDYAERAFATVGANAPEKVKRAWMEAAKESGVDGLGMSANGMLTHISQMMARRLTNQMKGAGGTNDLLGNTVQSAVRAAQQALYDLDHPCASGNAKSIEVQRQQVKERAFYKAFLEKLGAPESDTKSKETIN